MHDDLTFEQSIGQHLVVGLQGTTIDDSFREIVRSCKVGNVILLGRNIANTKQLKQLCSDIRTCILEETHCEPLILINEEGGMDSCLHTEATHLPAAMAIGATGDQGNAFSAGRIIAEELKALGINGNLAPVLDVNTQRMNPIIGIRSYADTPETVADFGLAMFRGQQEGNILSIAKHFPGIGDTETDAHSSLPTIERTKEDLYNCELVPFCTAIEQKIPAIMINHAVYPAIEEDQLPASMSRRIVTDLLRDELGFTALVCTECLEMGGIQNRFGTVQAGVEAIRAGVDLIIISHTHQLVTETFQAIAQSFESTYLNWEEHQASIARIKAAKQLYTKEEQPHLESVGSEAHREVAKAIMARGICIGNLPQEELPDLGEHPLFMGCNFSPHAQDTKSFAYWMANELDGRYTITSEDPTKEDIIALMEETRGATSIVIGTYNGHMYQGQLALANAMAGTGLPTIVVALRNPYDLVYLAENIHSLAAFEYTPLAFEAIRCILTKERSATGTLPIHW